VADTQEAALACPFCRQRMHSTGIFTKNVARFREIKGQSTNSKQLGTLMTRNPGGLC